ncbi:MAG: class I SAM-dependent methyltransferase [Deltaproteobacteria bacterium]|nr:class I SAM-dependent methyltransferase [Deltaproteobacteria bacterium]
MAPRSLANRLQKRVLKALFGFNKARRYQHLERIVHEIQPRRLMEIGCFRGENGRRMIDAALAHHPASEIEFFGFDLFEWLDEEKLEAEVSKRPPPLAEVRARLEGSGAKIRLVQGDTTETLPRLRAELPRMDLVFIDGGHSLATIASDWQNVEPLLHERSVVILDDYWETAEAGAKTLVDALDRNRYAVRLLDPIDRFLTAEGHVFTTRFAEVRPK